VAEEAFGTLVLEHGEALLVPLCYEREDVHLLVHRLGLELERSREPRLGAVAPRGLVEVREGGVELGKRALWQLFEELISRQEGRQLPLELSSSHRPGQINGRYANAPILIL
jgi:hypothetical protein